jgi:hypothetical protein
VENEGEIGSCGWFCEKRSREVGDAERGSTRVNRGAEVWAECVDYA